MCSDEIWTLNVSSAAFGPSLLPWIYRVALSYIVGFDILAVSVCWSINWWQMRWSLMWHDHMSGAAWSVCETREPPVSDLMEGNMLFFFVIYSRHCWQSLVKPTECLRKYENIKSHWVYLHMVAQWNLSILISGNMLFLPQNVSYFIMNNGSVLCLYIAISAQKACHDPGLVCCVHGELNNYNN